MENDTEYIEFLGDSTFIKWGCIISKLVWKKSLREIGEAFEVSKPYVSKIVNKFLQDKEVFDGRIHNGGHNKKLKTPQKAKINEIIQEIRPSTVRKVANQLSEEMEEEFSTSIVRLAMKEIGYQWNKPLSVPFLTNAAIEKRLDYCENHLLDNFSNVCFLDESVFQLCENRQMVWWNPELEERPILEYPSDRSKVMVCGGISKKGITDLYFWNLKEEGGVDAGDYTYCLDQILLKRMDGLYGYGKWRMIHDNARIHTAYLTKDFLSDNGVRIIAHPPYSPDLNPIEKVWGYLKKKVMTKVYKNIDELIEAITDEWYKIPLLMINNYIDELIEAITDEWYKIPLLMINNYIDAHIARVKEVFEAEGNFPVK